MEPACLVCRSSEYLTQGCGGVVRKEGLSLLGRLGLLLRLELALVFLEEDRVM